MTRKKVAAVVGAAVIAGTVLATVRLASHPVNVCYHWVPQSQACVRTER